MADTFTLQGSQWVYRAGQYPAVHSWEFIAFLRAISGTAKARLYNVTDGAVVTDTEVSTTSATHVLLVSSKVLLLDGKVYRPQFGLTAGGAGRGLGAFLRMTPVAV